MRVCDRHPDRRARDAVILEQDDARFDLCDECKTEIVGLLTAPVEPVKRRQKSENPAAHAA